MKTLVTGAAGFIGSELVRQLIQAGQSVVAFDNLATGSWDNLAGLEPVECITGDIRDAEAVGRALRDVASVYHLACLNLRQSLLEAARGAAVERFVYVSTSEVYGTARTVPMSEEHPTFPATVYGASKLAGEAYARAFHATYGLPVALVRPFNSYGPRCHHEGSSGEVIPKFLLRARSGLPLVIFGDGRQTRDFTFVTDTARGILLAGTVPNAVGRTFNLGSGIEISMTALAGRIAPGVAVIHEPERPGDVRRLLADSTAARETLGFEPRVSFDEGLAILATWYELQSIPLPVLLQQEVVHNWRSG